MTHAVRSLVILTLLQLCRAQDTDDQAVEWYQAKVVTDDYSPKPIQEIFSTAKTSEPIVVLPTGTTAIDNDIFQVQGLPSPTPQQQLTVFSSPSPPQSTLVSTISSQTTTPEFASTLPVKTTYKTSPPSFTNANSLPPQTLSPVQIQPVQFLQPGIIQLQNQTLRGIIFPLNRPQVTINNQQTTPFRTSTTPVTFNTLPNQQTIPFRTTVPDIRTTLSQTTVSIQPRPTTVLSSTPVTLTPTTSLQPTPPTVTLSNSSLPFPLMKIRVVAPSGSVTNIRFISSTTKRPPTTRTTRTPRTPRTRNTYNGCLDTCGKKQPICATPLATQLNVDNLKGFPSICHMACHNSFKNNRYEKVVDGRCGKLRTHIRTIGSKKKLKKEELQKNQYTVVKDNNAIVEFESLV